MLFLKPGVRITGIRPEIVLAALALERVFAQAGVDLTITACVDGKHSVGSLHYAGAAIDVRTRDVPADKLPKLVAQIKACLGDDFDVLQEATHLHIEHQPKQALSNG
jgi:hypothetical protein